MITAVETILSSGMPHLAAGFVVFLRIGAAMAVLPAFGERSIPQRIRLGLALAFTAIVAPAVAEPVGDAMVHGPSLRLALAEIVVGLLLGLILRIFVLVLQMAGTIAAQSTSLSQIFGTAAVEPLPAIGHVMMISGLALAVMTGLHVRLAEVLIRSYAAFPPGIFPGPDLVAQWGLARVAHGFGLAFSLAAPFVIASFIYNLALGVINRAMPQLMVAFVGAPAITAGGLILLFLSLPVLLGVWIAGFNDFLVAPFGTG